MLFHAVEAVSPSRTFRAGWGWLVLTAAARAYLVFVLTLIACALLPTLSGFSGSVVQSDSMRPLISPGDVVLSQPMPADAAPPIGRVVTFRAPVGSAKSGFVLHRVVGANEDGSLVTAGDANADVDSTPLDPRDILSQGRGLIPWIGLPSLWARTGAFLPLAFWVLLTAVALLLEAFAVASRRAPRNSGRPRRPARLTQDAETTADAGSGHPASVSSPPSRIPSGARPGVTAVVALLTSTALATVPLGQVTASFSARTSTTENAWTVAGPATKLAFTTNPSGSTGGVSFGTQPRVTAQDAGGGVVAVSAAPVTLSITTPAGAVLTCTTNPKTAASGVAGFAGCTIDKAGTYTLTATSSGLSAATSTSFTIGTGPAARLAFSTSPSSATVNTTWATQPGVTVQDAGANTITVSAAPVTLSITTPAGASLTCTTNPKNAVSGVASFAGCKIDKAGTYTLTATSGTLAAATSNGFVVSAAPATKLAFITNASNATGGLPFATQPAVAVQDAAGGTVTASTAPVTLSITTPAGAVLTCTTNPKTAVSGVASFAGCKIDKIGIYTLRATSSGLTAATSAALTISTGPAAQLAFTASPSNATANSTFATQPRVAVRDAGGNTVTTSSAPVTLSITPPSGGATGTCTANPTNASSGVATFTGCKVATAGTFTFTASSGTLTTAISASFTITAGPATKLSFTTSPSGAARNTAFATQPVVTVQDANGNTVTTSTTSVTLSITSGTGGAILTCTTNPKNAASGVATFTGCRIDKTGTYTLRATASGLTLATSTNFTITP